MKAGIRGWNRRLGWGWDGSLRGQDGRLMEETEKEGSEGWNGRLGQVLVLFSESVRQGVRLDE